MQVAMLAPGGLALGGFGADDVPIAPANAAAAAKIVSACAVPPVTKPSKTAIEIFKLVPATADQNALALLAINYGANAQCVATSLERARQVAMPPTPDLDPPKSDPASVGGGTGRAWKIGLVVAAVAAAGATGYAIARARR